MKPRLFRRQSRPLSYCFIASEGSRRLDEERSEEGQLGTRRIPGQVLASVIPALPVDELMTKRPEEMEEARVAGSSSSQSRRLSSLPCPIARYKGYDFGSGDADHLTVPSPEANLGSESEATSRHVSPLASTSATPLLTPATSVAHSEVGHDSPCANRQSEKKRLSWLGSTPASLWTSHQAPITPGVGSAPSSPTRRRAALHSHSQSGSWSTFSTSSSKKRESTPPKPTPEPDNDSGATAATSLVPNAQFLGFMLLMILLISSPLIKILSVVLFVAIVVLDDA